MSPSRSQRTAALALCGALALLLPLALAAPEEEAAADLALAEGDGARFTNGIGMTFVRIRAGKFTRGSPDSQDERPPHEVTISRDFYLGIHEVTQKQYRAVMGTNPSHYSATGAGQNLVKGMNTDDFPVENVSWDDTQEYLKKLNARAAEGARRGGYRLPTEAEWEYACKAGTKTRYHFGDAIDDKKANFSGSHLRRTVKVGSYPPNAWGLYDMHGNVWEWCQDWFAPYNPNARKDPKGPDLRAGMRAIRGGGWESDATTCRSAQRGTNTLNFRGNFNGFRVAWSARRPR
jgi:formylglycine-generating enzyme required for sulfatase activity